MKSLNMKDEHDQNYQISKTTVNLEYVFCKALILKFSNFELKFEFKKTIFKILSLKSKFARKIKPK